MSRGNLAWQQIRRSVATLGLAAVTGGLLAASWSLGPTAGWIPRLVLMLLLALLAVQLVLEVRERMNRPARAAQPAGKPLAPVTQGASETGALLWLGGALLAVLALGTSAGSAVYALAYLRVRGAESWLHSAGYALALGATLELVFGGLLQAELYRGWLGQLLD